MEVQREKDRAVELTNDLKKARVVKKVNTHVYNKGYHTLCDQVELICFML